MNFLYVRLCPNPILTGIFLGYLNHNGQAYNVKKWAWAIDRQEPGRLPIPQINSYLPPGEFPCKPNKKTPRRRKTSSYGKFIPRKQVKLTSKVNSPI